MTHAPFVHLHVHSAYSLSEGALKIPELIGLCQEHAMPAVAVTDTNNLFGAMEFAAAAAQAGVQPIIGCQISFDVTQKTRMGAPHILDRHPIVLLAQSEEGYQNLLKIVSHAYLGGEPGDPPCVNRSTLTRHHAGLIMLTGGIDGPISAALLAGQSMEASEKLLAFKDIFGDRLYVEIQRHGHVSEDKIEASLIELAYLHDIPLVGTNDCFFADRAMFQAHDVLLANAQSTTVSDQNRHRVTPDHYFKSASEMAGVFKDLPEAIENTIIIAKRCAFMPEERAPILPAFPVEEGKNEPEDLRIKAEKGLKKRLARHRVVDEKPYWDRLKYELGVITEMGFPGYFLIVSDFMNWCVENDVPIGPGRGSGAGSVVAWALKITGLDPLRWGLLFERFLNPERVSMPDFDIDFCQERRDEVISYVQQKYGADRVAQIITFGKLQARAVLRDVGRVLEMPYGQVDRIAKMVPNNPAAPVTLQEAIDADQDIQKMRDEEEDVARLLDIGLKLEGLYRHASTHAAGLVIGDRSLDELVPLYRDPRSEMPVTQFDMKRVEKAGLVKFDFLGLKTLTVLKHAVDLVKENGTDIDLDNLPLDDTATYEMLARGETTGVFQLESAGMRDALKKLQIDRFEDIIAVVALYRPGPMDNIPVFIERKHGREEPDYLHPLLEPILKETFGIMIYQEQVMEVAKVLAGYSLGSADLLRRAMGKKIKKEMDAQRKNFIEGAKSAHDVKEKTARHIFDQVAKFAGYGFNKSHAAAYAMIAYQTAYLKANYPYEFMAASMTLDMGNTDKLNIFRQELDRMEVPLLPPSINKSYADFAVEEMEDGQKGIRYALGALKGTGAAAMEVLVRIRDEGGPFKNPEDLAQRLDIKALNKRQLEALCYSGAFDEMIPNRAAAHATIETILAHAHRITEDRITNQSSLFGGAGGLNQPGLEWANSTDWPAMERLQHEFEAIGFYLSAHPLDGYQAALDSLKVVHAADVAARLLERGDLTRMKLAGMVTATRERTSARGNKYAFVSATDPTGVYEVTVFSETLSACRDLLNAAQPLLFNVDSQVDGDGYRLTCQDIQPLEAFMENIGGDLTIEVKDTATLQRVTDLLAAEKPGPANIILKVSTQNHWVEIPLPKAFSLSPESRAAIQSLS